MKKLKMALPDRVLGLLLKGSSIKIKDEEYIFDENYDLCVKRKSYISGEDWNDKNTGKPVFLKTLIDLKDFIHLCAKIKDDDYILACADITLTQINRGGGICRMQDKRSSKEEMYILPDTFNRETEEIEPKNDKEIQNEINDDWDYNGIVYK